MGASRVDFLGEKFLDLSKTLGHVSVMTCSTAVCAIVIKSESLFCVLD